MKILAFVTVCALTLSACASGGEAIDEPAGSDPAPSSTSTVGGSATDITPGTVPTATTSTTVAATADEAAKAPVVPSTTTTAAAVSSGIPGLDGVVASAASSAGVPVSEVTILTAVAVVWPDAGLGCSKQEVLQVATNGYWIVLQITDRLVDYRAGADAVFRVCVDGLPPVDSIVDR
ncbi:MAG: hypothetical protein OEQ47_18560 [Acidimicrobiia bacterium]|nr:hypothetical protein [Acidimicrobiia bacterium]